MTDEATLRSRHAECSKSSCHATLALDGFHDPECDTIVALALVDEARAERDVAWEVAWEVADALAEALQAWSWMWEYSTGEDYNQDVAHAESLTAPALVAYDAARKARP